MVVIIHVLVHQGVALVVDNVGKTKLDAHNFADNSSIFIIKKSNYITFALENDCGLHILCKCSYWFR